MTRGLIPRCLMLLLGVAPYEKPRGNLTGDTYFTDGRRLLMWISGQQVPLNKLEVLDLSPYDGARKAN
jgi:hypothetical protein